MPDRDARSRGRTARLERRRAAKALRQAVQVPDGVPVKGRAESGTAPYSGNGLADAGRSDDGELDVASVAGLVAGVQRGGVVSVLVGDCVVTAKLSRELLQQHLALVVGDRVHLAPDGSGGETVVAVEPRRTRLARIREDRSRRSAFSRQEAVLVVRQP